MAPVGLLFLVACPAPPPAELRLEGPSEVRVQRLGPVPAPAVASSEGQAPQGLTWSFSRPGVVTFDQGAFLAVGPGEVEVTGEWEGQRVSWKAWVELRTELAFVGAPERLPVGETADLALSAGPSAPPPPAEVTWTSSDPAVLEVSGGRLRGIAPGTAFVTASAGGSSAMAEVAVTAPVGP